MTKRTKRKKRQQSSRAVPRPRRDIRGLLLVAGTVLLLATGVAVLMKKPASQPEQVPVTVTGSPNLIVDRDVIDFGDVQVNKMVRASFELSNTGDQPLSISYPPVASVVEGC
jgi:cell division septal protein FtsQ